MLEMVSPKNFGELNKSSFPINQRHSVSWQRKLKEIGGLLLEYH